MSQNPVIFSTPLTLEVTIPSHLHWDVLRKIRTGEHLAKPVCIVTVEQLVLPQLVKKHPPHPNPTYGIGKFFLCSQEPVT
jgi:hypothetical protein